MECIFHLVEGLQVTDKEVWCQLSFQPNSLTLLLDLIFYSTFLLWDELWPYLKIVLQFSFFVVWINMTKVKLHKFFVQESHHWIFYFLFCFTNILHHLTGLTGYRWAVYIIFKANLVCAAYLQTDSWSWPAQSQSQSAQPIVSIWASFSCHANAKSA